MRPHTCTFSLILMTCFAACVQGRVLLQVTDFDLILGVQPTGSLDYGGRHITIAKVTAPSREAAAAVLKQCNQHLADAKTHTLGWVMKGPPTNCLGHMDAGADSCKDHHPWDLQKDGYTKPTPTIAIASKTLDAYAECLAGLPSGSGVKISVKGPVHSKHHTVWHSALYNTADGQAELNGFVTSKARWVPFLNGRHIGGPGCPATLDPQGAPGPVGNRCWHWTPVA